MKKESILYGTIGILAGLLIAGFTAGYAVNNNQSGMMRMMGINQEVMDRMHPSGHDQMSMGEMSTQLQNKTGDDFDKTFIEMMISHHQGAIDMANLAIDKGKHDEIKKLGEAIITAQMQEIEEMQQWQKDWGYQATEMMQMMH